MATRIPLFAANWKMNKAVSDCAPYVSGLKTGLDGLLSKLGTQYGVLIAPPATHLFTLANYLKGTGFEACAQNCGTAKAGAFTGEVSPGALRELGCAWVILGHSERRHIYKEENSLIASRLKAAWEEGLKVVLCVGERLEERKGGKTFDVLRSQLEILKGISVDARNLVVAYEPVWAIGTGEVATPKQAQEAHKYIRDWISKELGASVGSAVRIQYGGSVKPDNAASLMAQPDVDGFLVGGASLDANTFAEVIKTGLESRL